MTILLVLKGKEKNFEMFPVVRDLQLLILKE